MLQLISKLSSFFVPFITPVMFCWLNMCCWSLYLLIFLICNNIWFYFLEYMLKCIFHLQQHWQCKRGDNCSIFANIIRFSILSTSWLLSVNMSWDSSCRNYSGICTEQSFYQLSWPWAESVWSVEWEMWSVHSSQSQGIFLYLR